MALKAKHFHPWLSRLHLFLRLVGLTGLVAIAVAAVLAQVQGLFGTDELSWREALAAVGGRLWAALQGEATDDVLARRADYVFRGGAAGARRWRPLAVGVWLRCAGGRRR